MTAARRRGRPPRISRDDIIKAAIGIGLDRFSVAEIADELEVSVGALYRHVDSRERIHSLACDALWSRLDRIVSPQSPWHSYLGTIVGRAGDLATRHPGLAEYVTHGPYEPGTIAVFDELIAGVCERESQLTAGQGFVVVSRALHMGLGYLFGQLDVVDVNRNAVRWVTDSLLDGMAATIDRGHLPPDVNWPRLRDAVTIK